MRGAGRRGVGAGHTDASGPLAHEAAAVRFPRLCLLGRAGRAGEAQAREHTCQHALRALRQAGTVLRRAELAKDLCLADLARAAVALGEALHDARLRLCCQRQESLGVARACSAGVGARRPTRWHRERGQRLLVRLLVIPAAVAVERDLHCVVQE